MLPNLKVPGIHHLVATGVTVGNALREYVAQLTGESEQRRHSEPVVGEEDTVDSSSSSSNGRAEDTAITAGGLLDDSSAKRANDSKKRPSGDGSGGNDVHSSRKRPPAVDNDEPTTKRLAKESDRGRPTAFSFDASSDPTSQHANATSPSSDKNRRHAATQETGTLSTKGVAHGTNAPQQPSSSTGNIGSSHVASFQSKALIQIDKSAAMPSSEAKCKHVRTDGLATSSTDRDGIVVNGGTDEVAAVQEKVKDVVASAAQDRNRCVPLIPTPQLYSSTLVEPRAVDIALSFHDLLNYPQYLGRGNISSVGTKHCVMCGEECLYVSSKKDAPNNASQRVMLKNCKGVCTVCSDQVWLVVDSKLEVKRCQACHRWYPWANFQGSYATNMVKKCQSCRSRLRERAQWE